jgi:hypothetical protein
MRNYRVRDFEPQFEKFIDLAIEIGKEAMKLWKLYDFERPDYKKFYVKLPEGAAIESMEV